MKQLIYTRGSKHFVSIIRSIFTVLFLSLSFGLIIGCTNPEPGPNDNNQDVEVEYYVKYASDGLNGNGIYAYNASYTDETGKNRTLSNQSADCFERTIGPVKYGFKAHFEIHVDNSNDTRGRAVRIEVKKGENPFVVKAENSTSRGGVGVSYTIDF